MVFLEAITASRVERILETLLEQGAHLGIAILKALIIFVIGRFVIKIINRLFRKMLERRDVAPGVKTFVGSMVNVLLIILLVISVIGALGVQTTSFAALLASFGIAIGAALSGNLSNFAGGLVILLFKPFKVGDYISSADGSGTVAEIQIFHTVLTTSDNIKLYIPNGSLSSGYVNNYNVDKRRVEWIFGVDYGEDFDKVKETVLKVLSRDSRILPTPEPLIELNQLDASSVNVVVRVWVNAGDYWSVYFAVNQNIYKAFNAEGIDFPFPQMIIHQANTQANA
ncbi:mechanosensitive ion channel family protein [Dysgonomonas sp. 216]|uniref:mechanosensitive ion channel family protein n=1 Tax=Dysgonomonas sp. 216 TaxID=2302934 RepID=UPI0013D2061A|nr:mechanosensitive ion channel domain-containing protein [Dysgonomonas sp. 216]NDW19473.1 mechanosensitive ion channel family protein [Dysgonomonas sp. 216]